MRVLLLACCVTLAACATTTEMAAAAPAKEYRSAKPRGIVAECLLNRISSDDLLPQRTEDGGTTVVAFASRGLAAKPGIYRFAIRDDGSGSAISAWRFAHASLANAETCF